MMLKLSSLPDCRGKPLPTMRIRFKLSQGCDEIEIEEEEEDDDRDELRKQRSREAGGKTSDMGNVLPVTKK